MTIAIPQDSSFLDNLILQRTDEFNALGGVKALVEWERTGNRAQLSAYLRQGGLINRYLEMLEANLGREVDLFVDHVSARPMDGVVSIGPGNGLFELLLLRRVPAKRLLLIDIEESGDLHRHGYSDSGSGYASLSQTKTFLTVNGISDVEIVTCNPRLQPLPDFEFDLLYSILSMGFHYPCTQYADFILKNMRAESMVVMDRRDGVVDAGLDAVMKQFVCGAQWQRAKHHRIYLQATSRGCEVAA